MRALAVRSTQPFVVSLPFLLYSGLAAMAFRASNPHLIPMARTHPHAEASYRVISRPDGSFGVEVKIPDSYPTTVSPFATETDANAWIDKHKSRVEADSSTNTWFRRQGSRSNPPAGR